VGTEDEPADPLAKSDGQKFIPQEVSTVRGEISENGADGAPDDIAQGDTATDGEPQSDASSGAGTAASEVRYVEKNSTNAAVGVHSTTAAALQNSDYGAYWGTYQGTQAFFEKSGSMFVQQAKGVIDVSEWQSDINWDAVKASGVEGAIIRIGYSKSSVDKKAARNISECKRLGIPFGIYMYSYASNAAEGTAEGEGTASRLKSMGVSAKDLSYPVYYDLENWVSGGNHAPTDPGTWDGIVNAWYWAMLDAGYTNENLGVYSYTSYLGTALNSSFVHSKTTWVAEYGSKMNFSHFGGNQRGWQYWSSGRVNGISGSVDLNTFGNDAFDPSYSDYDGLTLTSLGTKVTDLSTGIYLLYSAYGDRFIDVEGQSLDNGARLVIWPANNSDSQRFLITAIGDGQYTIKSEKSGKVLDASGPPWVNGTAIVQYSANGADNQKWEFYEDSQGYVYISSKYAGARNKVFDVIDNNSAAGTCIQIWAANRSAGQRFLLVKESDFSHGKSGRVVIDGISYWYESGIRMKKKEVFEASLNSWYYYDASGAMAKGWVVLPDGRRVYYDLGSGQMLKGESYISGEWYLFGADGAVTTSKDVWMPSQNKWVRYDDQGRMVKGEDYRYGGWYYFDPASGAMAKGWVVLPDGRRVYYDLGSGQMLKGIHMVDGQQYNFDIGTGALL
jgi:glucan-binding YG repeat protein/GH25 family lysozyme M1 (1,4-beta-N-acetylmuramidase)